MPERIYLDWNASAPLRPAARAAMVDALDAAGNPSAVHSEGRLARGLIEKARAQVAALVGVPADRVVFTSGATEAAALALHDKRQVWALATEHDAVREWAEKIIPVDAEGQAQAQDLPDGATVCWSDANGETGALQSVWPNGPAVLRDITQSAGRIPVQIDAEMALISAHKLGGPRGVGALITPPGGAITALLRGGGQELSKRSGTENVAGIVAFGVAAVEARAEIEAGVWDAVQEHRDRLEAELMASAGGDLIIIAESAPRLPNTSCFAVPGWKGETQVMQLDLAGVAVSAGSACSSGKVEPSHVLRAMGYDDLTASSAIRVSMGPTTTDAEVSRFIEAWTGLYRRMKQRAA